MKRGDLVTVALQGDFGKPRPALIIQSDLFMPEGETVVVLLLSSGLILAPIFRITLVPNKENGLKTTCDLVIDAIFDYFFRLIKQTSLKNLPLEAHTINQVEFF